MEAEESLPCGLTPEEMSIAVSVVSRCAALPREEYASNRSLRQLRQALTPLVWASIDREQMDKNSARKAHKRALNREKQRLAAAERLAADRCELRQGRLARLAALQSAEASSQSPLAAIPDGYVEASPKTMAIEPEEKALSASTAACYSCRRRFGRLVSHHFYGIAFCPACAELNFRKRFQTCDMTNRTCLVTGARIKIGFIVALKLLRAGARVVATSRFPRDALRRYSLEQDFEAFQSRLEVVGCDFRDLRAVQQLAEHVDATFPEGLDVLVNNACQTVRQPEATYAALLEGEKSGESLAVVTTTPEKGEGLLTTTNSWTMKLADVPVTEAAECFAINALAPLSLCSKLKPAMLRCLSRDRFIVNVSAAEGKFTRIKTVNHPHTNMAKAALNMMTRTSSADYAKDRIYMNAVDTGWINDQRPDAQATRLARETGFQTPIDEIDAAARILDPVFSAIAGDGGEPRFGYFFKDYEPTEW